MLLVLKNLDSFSGSFIEASISQNDASVLYSIRYLSNLEEIVQDYSVYYSTNYTDGEVKEYRIVYDSIYGETFVKYSIRFYSSVEIIETTSRYQVLYTSVYGSYIYTNYILRYTSVGPSSQSYRGIYRLVYDTTGSKEETLRYRIKYTKEYFKDRSENYKIKYTSVTPFTFETSCVLLRSPTRTSALFCLKGNKVNLQDSLFVFSNLPRYQLVQMDYLEEKVNISWLTDTEYMRAYNLFNEDSSSSLDPALYLLIRDVEDINNISLDVYNKETLERISIAKSYFFNLNNNSFIMNLITADSELYHHVNYDNSYYNYNYLNFAEKSLTPNFKLGDNCCFNVKINSKNSGGLCSPF